MHPGGEPCHTFSSRTARSVRPEYAIGDRLRPEWAFDSAGIRRLCAPGHVEHRFRRKPNTHSDVSRTPIPAARTSLAGAGSRAGEHSGALTGLGTNGAIPPRRWLMAAERVPMRKLREG